MNLVKSVIGIVSILLLAACASHKASSDTDNKSATKQESKETTKAPEGDIVGKIVPGSKFSKIKLGMSEDEVVKLIGPPSNDWVHPTGKASIPFYFGDDRWLKEYAYNGEGQLSFEYRGGKRLLHIVVDRKTGSK